MTSLASKVPPPTARVARWRASFVDASAALADLFERLRRADDLALHVNRQPDVRPDELPALLDGASIAIIDHTALPTPVAARCPGLKHVVFLGTGARSYMDPEALATLGISVHTIKGYGDTAVAECAFALMWAAARGLARMDRELREGRWLRTEGMQLRGKTLGLIGFGGIAQELARLALGAGMHVVAWNRSPREHAGVEFVGIETLLATSHVVSLHLLLTDQTRGFLSRERINAMRDGAILVNTARGALLDEAALVDALACGKLAHAGLDVFTVEPLPALHPFTTLPNVTLSAHSAFRTPEASANLVEAALAHCRRIAGTGSSPPCPGGSPESRRGGCLTRIQVLYMEDMMFLIFRLREALGACVLVLAGALTLPAGAQNVIQSENAKTAGVSSAWQIPDASYAGNQEIEGYASATSVNRGESISLFVQTKTTDPTYTINVYRIGWYGGAGGRLVHGPITRTRTAQPNCPMTDTATRLIECNWTDPYVLTVPNNAADATDWASGVYLAKLTGGSTGKQSYIIFVVRDDTRSARAMFQTSVTTYAAYNHWGGYSFYDTDSLGLTPAQKVSFNRPYKNPQRYQNGKGAGEFFAWEINLLRFVEREGYDAKYATNIDTHVAPARLLEQRLFISVGHDEYYSRPMYDAVEAARNAGVNLAFLGANGIYWQVRLEASTPAGQANRTVVGYKYAFDPLSVTNPDLSTSVWRDPPLNRPEAALIGVQYDYNSLDLDVVIADCSSWVCAGTNLLPGSILPGMLGYEVDRIAPSSPAGITVIASSPYVVNGETRFANVTYYSAASGAGVFATGSMQWNWGLDSFSPGASEHGDRTNVAVQQITRNVFNRFTDAGNAAPQITTSPVTTGVVGAAYSYDVNATDADGDALTYALTQAPAGMTINSGTGLIAWLPSATQTGSQAVALRVSDPGGLFAAQSFTLTVAAANAAPQITTTPVTIAAVAAAYSYDVNATDPNGDTLTYALTQAPAGMTINAGTGLIGWTPTAAQAGGQAVTVRVSDPGGLFATQSFTISVDSGNAAPQITTTPVTIGNVGAAYSYDVNATDANGDTLTYSLTQGPAGMSINTTNGLIAWTPSAAQTGSQAVTVRVADPGGLFATQSFTISVDSGNAAPQITTTPVTIGNVGAAYSYDVNATDANGDTLTYSLTQGPAGMSINTTNGLIAWTPSAAQTGSQAVTVRVGDPDGLFATQSFAITVGAGTAPSTTRADLATPSSSTAVPGGSVAITLNWYRVRMASDYLQFMHLVNASGTAWSVDDHWTTSASWTAGLFAQTRTITAPASLPAGTYDIRVGLSGGNPWTDFALLAGNGVTDPDGSHRYKVGTLTVSTGAVAPQITTPPVAAAAVGTAYSYDVNATDANGDTLTYALTQAPTGMTISASTGLIAWTPTSAQAGSQAVTIRVTDPGGLFATQAYTITVTAANGAPQITTTPVAAAAVGTAYSYDVDATDANGDTLTYALTQAPTGMTINTSTGLIAWLPTSAQAGSQAVTVRVTDPGGLFATQAYTITVTAANVAPQITTTTVTTAAVGTAYGYDVDATDANGDTLTYALTQAPTGMTINTSTGLIAWLPTSTQTGSQAVTVRVSDPGGLAATQSFTITVSGAAPSTTRADLATPSTYSAAVGATLSITLNWYRVRMATDDLQFMHLVDASGATWSVDDHWTTSASWTVGQFSQTRPITLPASLPLGTYDIRVGLSGGNPWTDFALLAGSGVTDPDNSHRYKVGTLTVR